MDFLTLAKKRFSCRNYSDKKVEDEKLKKILEAGRISPTAHNFQPQRILVIQSEEGLKKINEGANLYKAPLALIICADKDKSWKRIFDNKTSVDIDASIVTTHMMLEAAELGLDSVWICYFNPDIIRKNFNIPENYEIVNILAIGYGNNQTADPERHNTMRQPIEKTTFFENF